MRFLKLLALLLLASPASAGLNAGASARLYWVNSSNQKADYRNENACKMKFVVTVTGVTSLLGANCQILVGGYYSYFNLPPSWYMGPEGCGGLAGALRIERDGFPVGVENAWIGGTDLLEVQARMYDPSYRYGPGNIWMQTIGTSGVAKSSTTEYGLYAVTIDQTVGNCAGNCLTSRFSQTAQCLQTIIPDSSGYRWRRVIQLIDKNLEYDTIPVVITADTNYGILTWKGYAETPKECPTDGITATTWGRLRRSYR